MLAEARQRLAGCLDRACLDRAELVHRGLFANLVAVLAPGGRISAQWGDARPGGVG